VGCNPSGRRIRLDFRTTEHQAMTDPSVFLTLAFAAVAILAIWLGTYMKKKYEERKASLAAWAEARGFSFHPHGVEVYARGIWSGFNRSESFLGRFQDFSPFGQGDRWRVPIMMTGKTGDRQWTIFDYEYQTESGGKNRSRTTHRYTVCEVQCGCTFPHIDIRPENVFDKIGGALGFKDLSFELDEFNRCYYVKTNDERIAYSLIHPEMIEFLMRVPRYPWQIDGRQIVIAVPGWLQVAEIQRIVADMDGFLELIPEFLREDLSRL
jgi:hypothetical protein